MRIAILLALLCIAPPAAAATDYIVRPGSTLAFTATYMDEPFEGRFDRFTPRIRFDPSDLAGSRFEVRIRLDSADTRNAERDEMLVAGEFFDAGTEPEAVYRATRFRALGGGRFVADGELTLRGITRPVPLEFSWTAGAEPVLEGEATLSRLAFRVGTGDWTDTDLLPDRVKVTTRLVLAPGG